MIKLALIGKNIQHSLSPSIYKNILGPKVHYDLLDYTDESEIPPVDELFKVYSGINITSPYKKHFLNSVELTASAKKLGAINCLKIEDGKVVGENTDYLAIVDILSRWKSTYGELDVALLGDGVMSKITEMALKQLEMNYKVYSRKQSSGFSYLDFEQAYSNSLTQLIVINTCAREYVFQGSLPKSTLFWDYNYHFLPHQHLKNHIKLYIDGEEMLDLQAKYAVAFWSFNPSYFK